MSSEASQKTSKSKKVLYLVAGVFIAIVIIANLSSNDDGSNKSAKDTLTSSEAAIQDLKVGSTQRAGYFDVTVNNFATTTHINTSNEFTSLSAPEGSVYAVVDVTFKNQDTEGRTILSSGELLIDFDGKQLTYDKSETVLEKGYGALLEAVNPLMVHRSKLVYTIPSNLHGSIYWQPSGGKPVLLGKI